MRKEYEYYNSCVIYRFVFLITVYSNILTSIFFLQCMYAYFLFAYVIFDVEWLDQNTLKNLKCITSSHAFQLVKDQIEKSKSDVLEYQALYEKLQVVTGR